jgi:hypothetical protein
MGVEKDCIYPSENKGIYRGIFFANGSEILKAKV